MDNPNTTPEPKVLPLLAGDSQATISVGLGKHVSVVAVSLLNVPLGVTHKANNSVSTNADYGAEQRRISSDPSIQVWDTPSNLVLNIGQALLDKWPLLLGQVTEKPDLNILEGSVSH